ncbi:MAG: IS1182 family transposase [Planctomycetes bacterium]|nr:IS1182 family transposase [Planctomycetota bacterium]
MNDNPLESGREVEAKVRLRKPDRRQTVMVISCPDDLVPEKHDVRMVAALVEKMDLSAFRKSIKAREGHAGRDATDPALLVALWLYATIRGFGSARKLDRLCTESRPFQWLCGGVSVNHHLLSDFRMGHADALDDLFTRSLAALVDKQLVSVKRISQDGVRVRASAGGASFRREARLTELLDEARRHVQALRRQLDHPDEAAAEGSRQAAARRRAAEERMVRLEQAVGQLPALKEQQEQAATRLGDGQCAQKVRDKELRVSTTDPEARVMKMPNGGFNPAFNVQLATDTESRAIVGVEVSNKGNDSAGLAEPMREQVEKRTGQKVEQHLLDGGYIKTEDLERAHGQGVALFIPSKPARNPARRGHELEPRPGDSDAVRAWKERMRRDEGKEIYKQRASTSETVNADLRCHRGLGPMTVRGLKKVRCVALWCALAYNVMHFGAVLLT